MDAMKMILVITAGWMNRQQQHVIDYLQEEIRTPERAAGAAR